MYNFITGLAGEKNGRRFFPVIATFFIYIAFANWISLTPIFNTIGIYVPLHAEESEFHEEAYVFKDAAASASHPRRQVRRADADDCAEGHEGDECRHEAIEHATAENASRTGQEVGVLFPYLRGINTDLMTPLSFALISAFFVEMWGITTLGFFKYAGKFFNFKSPIGFFVGILEFIAELARLVSFSARLFGNMLAGEILARSL